MRFEIPYKPLKYNPLSNLYISERIYEICFTGFKILINQQFFKFQILALVYSLILVCFLLWYVMIFLFRV